MFFSRLCCALAFVVLSGCHWKQAPPLFQSDVSTEAKPWTHLNFKKRSGIISVCGGDGSHGQSSTGDFSEGGQPAEFAAAGIRSQRWRFD